MTRNFTTTRRPTGSYLTSIFRFRCIKFCMLGAIQTITLLNYNLLIKHTTNYLCKISIKLSSQSFGKVCKSPLWYMLLQISGRLLVGLLVGLYPALLRNSSPELCQFCSFMLKKVCVWILSVFVWIVCVSLSVCVCVRVLLILQCFPVQCVSKGILD